MPNKKIITAIIAIVLVVGIGVGATLAYFTDLEQETVAYTVGEVKVRLEGKGVGDKVSGMLPGMRYTKEPSVRLDSTTVEECYVRVKVSYPAGNENLASVMKPPAANKHWVRSDAGNNTYYFYYTASKLSNTLGEPRKTATPAFLEVVVRNDISDMTLLQNADNQSMRIEAQAIQAEGLPDGLDISDIEEIFDRYY